MPTARKTKSGNWRCQAFDHVEILPDGKKKYHHRSFTARTKYEAERLAAEFMANKNRPTCELKLTEAIDKYFKRVYRRAISEENKDLSAKLNAHFEKLHS
jgi:hypothetical protein